MTRPNPTIVLVPGTLLRPAAAPAARPRLSHSNSRPPIHRRRAVYQNPGRTVVLVGHSYGRTVVSNASEGLGELERARQGRKGGIALVVYLFRLGMSERPWLIPDRAIDYSSTTDQADIFYHDVQPKLQQAAIATLRHGSRASFYSVVTHEPWQCIPCGYIHCDEDRAVPPALQEMFVALMRGSGLGLGGGVERPLPPVLTAHFAVVAFTVSEYAGHDGGGAFEDGCGE
ncbi:alpha/beta hydrolase [Aspergillus clavatus NRRL 1]|uniref:AB hydrolase-1 domain-containing protein n=1 Tax=Aspergillus clavatus (strain ATCC 1007 / CBS 513.65 / DSM 816 / NCTC 3887 / NRRL 1 / QM 1276 / 107) TaxID=344612 RepID=A1C5B9_ASPCL|nr:uncharacterized protein ACLA_002980 [Aspergillus clavatus NRRL 1]EAW14887.1 hypothetical protein ACLA_002980 [Aspergillus clavatus NRRL 1]